MTKIDKTEILKYIADQLSMTDDSGIIRNTCTTPRCVLLNLQHRIQCGNFNIKIPPRELLKCKGCGIDNIYDSWADKDLNTYCDHCVPRDRMLVQVDQRSIPGRDLKVDFGSLRYRYNRVTIHADVVYKGINGILMWPLPKFEYHCWVRDGQAYPLDDVDIGDINKFGIETFIYGLSKRTEEGRLRCTKCHKYLRLEDGKAVRFADFLCSKCLTKFNEDTEHQRKTGQVCRMCGQPRNECYC